MTGKERAVLGSGKLYVLAYTGEIPEDSVIETEENRLGDIQAGATLNYTPTFYDVKDDLGLYKETFLTAEDITLTSGILTWNANTISKLCSTAKVTEDQEKGIREIKIGGIQNFVDTKYLVRFVHATNGKKVTIVGQNKSALTFAFTPDKETVINTEFTATAMDDKGTLIKMTEPIEQ